MPYIDLKTSAKLSVSEKENIKSKLSKAISLMKKTENYLMVGILDGYSLYFGGKPLEKGAYVSVSVFGNLSAPDTRKMTKEICSILKAEADISPENVYVTYGGVENWGWNGDNF